MNIRKKSNKKRFKEVQKGYLDLAIFKGIPAEFFDKILQDGKEALLKISREKE